MPVSSLFTTGRQSSYGKVIAIGEDYFGGSIPLKYADVESGKYVDEITGNKAIFRIIEGIGITSWWSDECIFGANKVYHIFEVIGYPPQSHNNYRSMLVHFERGGEVLYDVWPQPGEKPDQIQNTKFILHDDDAIYDLQGQRLMSAPERGLYIQGGKLRKKIINK